MTIGKDSFQPLESEGKSKDASEVQHEGATAKWHEELGATQLQPGNTNGKIELAANDVQLGPNGLPITNDATTNAIFERMRSHMHGPLDSSNPSMDTGLGRRTIANGTDMEAGLYGPKSAQNAAQYNSVLQDFRTLDANFKKELTAHGMNGPAADQMRKFLYSSNNENQRNQFLKAYNLTLPQGFDAFEQKYGRKAPLALHWAMEQQ